LSDGNKGHPAIDGPPEGGVACLVVVVILGLAEVVVATEVEVAAAVEVGPSLVEVASMVVAEVDGAGWATRWCPLPPQAAARAASRAAAIAGRRAGIMPLQRRETLAG
jgi:hypothetical protein